MTPADPAAHAVAGPVRRPTPPSGARHFVVVTLDSLRFDSCIDANPVNMQRLGEVERRYSYASWTAPSHYNLLMGLLPCAEGRLMVDEAAIDNANIARWQRLVGHVPQQIFLFDDTVARNIAFGLSVKGAGRVAIDDRVKEMLALVGLERAEHLHTLVLEWHRRVSSARVR